MTTAQHVHQPSAPCNVMCPGHPNTVKRRPSRVQPGLLAEGQRLLEADRRRRVASDLRGGAYAEGVVARAREWADMGMPPCSPLLGDVVLFWNGHGFPRTALVAATADSMVGEMHGQELSSPDHLHLQVLSPLAYARWEMDVPRWTDLDDLDARVGCWSPR